MILKSSQTPLVPKKNLNEDFSSSSAMTSTKVAVTINYML